MAILIVHKQDTYTTGLPLRVTEGQYLYAMFIHVGSILFYYITDLVQYYPYKPATVVFPDAHGMVFSLLNGSQEPQTYIPRYAVWKSVISRKYFQRYTSIKSLLPLIMKIIFHLHLLYNYDLHLCLSINKIAN